MWEGDGVEVWFSQGLLKDDQRAREGTCSWNKRDLEFGGGRPLIVAVMEASDESYRMMISFEKSHNFAELWYP